MSSRSKIVHLRARKKQDFGIHKMILIFGIVVLVIMWSGAPTLNLLKERSLNKRLRLELKNELSRNKEIKKEIKRLKTPSYIELKARNDLGLVKQNEIQYYVLEKKVKSKVNTKLKQRRWWDKTLDFIEAVFVK